MKQICNTALKRRGAKFQCVLTTLAKKNRPNMISWSPDIFNSLSNKNEYLVLFCPV